MARRKVVADAANIHLVLARDMMRRRIDLRVWIVFDQHTRRFAENHSCFTGTDLLLGLDQNRFAVPYRHRDANAGRGDGQLRIVEDLARLMNELHLLLVVAVDVRLPTAWDDVVGELM